MKKLFLRVFLCIALLVAVLIFLAFWNERTDRADVVRHASNPNLRTIKTGWPGTPVDQKGRFVNHEFPFLPKGTDLIKWKLIDRNPQKDEKKRDTRRLEVLDPSEFLSGEGDGILWLGHAAFFIRLDGVSILLDPVFGKPPLISTYIDVPSPIAELKRVDYVLISHDHRDHCDETSLDEIAQKFPAAIFLGGLGMEDVLKGDRIQTAGWFQQFETEKIKIYFLPVRHWSRRLLFDTNDRLWGGYIIQSQTATIYFGGDSGYGRHYKETAELFPNIDYFIIGIGGYQPRWFMEPNHNSPDDALKAFQDAKAKFLIPMHYGRFDLTDEPPNEPLRLLRERAAELNLIDRIIALEINESMLVK